jgi:hypothetical protein
MGKHRYTGTDHTVYPYASMDGHHRPLHAKPGMAPVDFDGAPPDDRWEPVVEVVKTPKTAPKRAASTAEAAQE